MWSKTFRMAGAALTSIGMADAAQAQAPAPVDIPLTYWEGARKLAINVGINGGAAKPYIFDTGSPVFNAAYNQSWWPGLTPDPNAHNVPKSSLPTNAQFCLGGTTPTFCRGYTGNLVQVQSLSFYSTPTDTQAVAQLNAKPGYVVNAVYNYGADAKGSVNIKVPFDSPPVDGYFYGTFGAGDFATNVTTNTSPDLNPADRKESGYYAGGILGQTIVEGATQGYVVSANGQKNPVSSRNGPQQINGIDVTIGGRTMQPVTACSPCVTVGLTPQMLGQFWAEAPESSSDAGVIPWARKSRGTFPNPYGGAAGNNSSREMGLKFKITLTPAGGSTPAIVESALGLLDSGTGDLNLQTSASAERMARVSHATPTKAGHVKPGVVLTITGVTPDEQPIAGLPTTSEIVTKKRKSHPETYNAMLTGEKPGTVQNTIGISFFLQNSVMYDLTNEVVGYTPFFVTAAPLQTTLGGPLIVNGTNVPLGLAGVVSGPGGVTIDSGGAVQLSATNTYTGLTTIAGASGGMAAGQLLVSGPGSIANSAGVTNNGIFDISRAWSPVNIRSLSGSGQVNLGGQDLTLTHAGGVFSGTIADGGAYPVGGGSLTLAGGLFTLAGSGTYTGGTIVSGGSFILSGSLGGPLSVLPGGSFVVDPAGSYTNPGATVINRGTTIVNGTMTASALNTGTLGGSGSIAGNVVNAGWMAPGNSIGTLAVGGNYVQGAGGSYLVEADGLGRSDRINVAGSAMLLGGVVAVDAQPGTSFAPRTTYRILNAAGGLSGTFAAVTDPYPFILSSLSYDANNAYLTLQTGGFAAQAQNRTQFTVGSVLDANALNATGDFATVLGNLRTATAAQGQAVMTALSGNNYAGFSTSMVEGAHLFMNNFAGQAGGGRSSASSRVALAAECDDVTAPNWGAWGSALGGLGTIGANQPVGGVTYNVGGFAAGLDRALTSSFRVGITAGYTTGSQWVSGFDGKGTSDTFLTGLYAGFAQDRIYADAIVGYAYSYNQMWRNIAIPGSSIRTARGGTGANQFYGQVETGYRFDLGTNAGAFAIPFARLQAYTGTQNGFAETGAQSLDLTVAGQTTNSLRSVIGAQLGGAIDLGWREKLAMQFRLGWSHEYADTARPVSATFAGAPAMPFTTFGVAPQRDGVVLGFSANTAIADATSAYLRYEGNISGQDNAHSLTVGVRMTW